MDPRVERTRQVVFRAAHALLGEGGLDAVTHSAVAQRSGVGRATLYRHWPRRQDLIREIVRQEGPGEPPAWSGDLRVDLTSALTHAAAVLSSPDGSAGPVSRSDQPTRVSNARRLAGIAEERQPVRAALLLAQRNGQLANDVSIEEAQALLLGPVLYHLLWATTPIAAGFIDHVVDVFMSAHDQRSVPRCAEGHRP